MILSLKLKRKQERITAHLHTSSAFVLINLKIHSVNGWPLILLKKTIPLTMHGSLKTRHSLRQDKTINIYACVCVWLCALVCSCLFLFMLMMALTILTAYIIHLLISKWKGTCVMPTILYPLNALNANNWITSNFKWISMSTVVLLNKL